MRSYLSCASIEIDMSDNEGVPALNESIQRLFALFYVTTNTFIDDNAVESLNTETTHVPLSSLSMSLSPVASGMVRNTRRKLVAYVQL